MPLNCPDANGNLNFTIFIDANITWALTGAWLQGNPLVCSPYDNVSQTITCSTPEPLPDQNPSWMITYAITSPEFNAPISFSLGFAKPQNCLGQTGPFSIAGLAKCPENGFVMLIISYNPFIDWTIVKNQNGIDLDCIQLSPSTKACLAPDELVNGKYRVHLEGFYQGDNYMADVVIEPHQNCDQPKARNVQFDPQCIFHSDIPGLFIWYDPVDEPPLAVLMGSGEIQCGQDFPGLHYCDIPQQLSGFTTDAVACFGPNLSLCEQATITVPDDCSSNSNQPQFEFMIGCANGKPMLLTSYAPVDSNNLPAFEINGNDLTCQVVNPGWAACDIPGQFAGQDVQVMGTFEGQNKDKDLTVPTCGAEQASILLGYKCLHGDPTVGVFYTPTNAAVEVTVGGEVLPCVDGNSPGIKHCTIPVSMSGATQSVKVCVNGQCIYDAKYIENCNVDHNGASFFFECKNEKPSLGIFYEPNDALLTAEVGGSNLTCTSLVPGNASCPIPESMSGSTQQTKVCVNNECTSDQLLVGTCDGSPADHKIKITPDCGNQSGAGIRIDADPAFPALITK